ncbi:nuclear transport factor 2 family protein [Coraliomargarita akajimensis]|uniref:Uncharacterized protein n=1 Tax=Coraliomargarita akajimensis (strain DSM 45221 / IAM 15411 / JCM 23193 / KCTC 12865 / 04OKA010-24) TaxID=583355 RepID=D5EKE7_CORAD|nr:nuclear transport factor 2 family protein [Coraliomargarita akajimensis]ADE54896.1 conserved hypothetical protein [Coraliomargarita akajimensis DSM 45221]
MDEQLIAAAKAFSLGDGEQAFAKIAEDVQWHIIGDHTILGIDGLKHACEEASRDGKPHFENHRTILGENSIVVEGSDIEADLHYCDIYSIRDGLISEITSYSLAGADE